MKAVALTLALLVLSGCGYVNPPEDLAEAQWASMSMSQQVTVCNQWLTNPAAVEQVFLEGYNVDFNDDAEYARRAAAQMVIIMKRDCR